ncbi:prp1 [Candida oxycetoniae]|uniref:Prp1 n=1 Tax=Candida oxycetoniae TaxID=497107 RepID=A0AAI9WWF6_9ASCO|nr:prp1 [Candida oxycetoniae]KAI3402977.2 prp1 [Candida oxycetoniae]
MDRLAFLDQEPPPGYVAGVGRGAVGFSTGADFKRDREDFDEEEEDNDLGSVDDIDEGGLLLSRKRDLDLDVEEEDKAYEEIERKLQSKRKRPAMVVASAVIASVSEKPRFNDLKEELKTLTDEDWLSLPEAGDMTRKNKRQRILDQQSQRFYAAPDSILASASNLGGNSISKKATELSAELDKLLPRHSAITQSSTTPMTEDEFLDVSAVDRDAKFADLKKGRLILASLRKSEPYKSSSWIQSARLEEEARNYDKARDIIQQGCKTIPGDEDVWLENVRLNMNDTVYVKNMLKEALNFCPKSEKLWLKWAELETENKQKRRIVMKGLEDIPKSVDLWKKLVNLENNQKTVEKLLSKAVELCPHEWEFWLALVNISTYTEAKSYLNKARKVLHGELKVWTAACKLEERENTNMSETKLMKLTDKAVQENKDAGPQVWYRAASECLKEGFNKTSRALVSSFLHARIVVDSNALMKEADEQIKNGDLEIGHYILDYLIGVCPTDLQVWERLLNTVKKTMNLKSLWTYYEKAISLNVDTVSLYLMFAQDVWKLSKDAEQARIVLSKADEKLDQDIIKVAVINLLFNSGQLEKAKQYVSKIIETEKSRNTKFWYKYIHILRCLDCSLDMIIRVSNEALTYFPTNWKLRAQNIQLLETGNDTNVAEKAAAEAVKACPSSATLWIMYSVIVEKRGIVMKARSILDSAMLKISNSPELNIAKVELEKRQNNITTAKNLANRNLKQFPENAYVWYQYLSLIPKMSYRKPEFLNALQKTQNSSDILMYIGVFFWQDGKFLKAKSWFERSLTANPNNGDAWGWMYNYLKQFSGEEERNAFLEKYRLENECDKREGRVYNIVKKNPKNYNKSQLEILEMVSLLLLKF